MKKKSLFLWAFLALSVALPVAAVQVWFSSSPSGNVGNGASYYIEATAYAASWWEWNDLWLYKNSSYVAGNGGSGYYSAGTWQTDSGPQTVEYFAEAWDWGVSENAVDWRYVTIDPPANQAPIGVCDYAHSSVTAGGNLHGSGWAADNEMGAPITRVDILVDGNDVGDATLGGDRSDVANAYGRSDYQYSGWSFNWGVGGLAAGTHSLEFRAWDNQGASTSFGYRTFTVTNYTPNNTLTSPAAQTVALGTTLTITANATDGDGNITTHNLDIQRPDGTWNWQGGFAYGEPYMGGPVGSAANSTRSATFTFNILGTWYVRSWVSDANGNNQHSATVAITVVDNVAPSKPVGLAASNLTETSFTLTWAASTDDVGVTGYEVSRDNTSIGTPTSLSSTISSLTGATTYVMKVRARDAAGNWSAWSDGLSVTTPAPLTAPTNLTVASKGSAFIALTWTAGSVGGGAPSYRIYRNGALVATVTTTNFTDLGLTAFTAYTYTVKTLNGSNQESAAATIPSGDTTTLAATLQVFTPLAQ